MSRLTRRTEVSGIKAIWCEERNIFLEGESGYDVANKLAHYEDLEEQLRKSTEIDIDSMIGEFMHYYKLKKENRLIELPCKVGEEVWTVHKEWGIQHATYHRADRILLDIENGHVFVKTKEEAQAKWKEFKRGKLAKLKGGE